MKKILYIICALWGFTACVEKDGFTDDDGQRLPIIVGSTYPSVDVTARTVIDGGFVAGDQMGIFVVDYEGDEPGEVLMQGNRASNMRFTLEENGCWSSPATLYWGQDTPADFYGYYPFDSSMSSAADYAFTVSEHQDTEASTMAAAGYESSDLLRAKTEKVYPTTETVTLKYSHLMAGVTIRLEMGTGFTATEWAGLDKTLLVKNTVTAGTVNLVTGTTTVGNSPVKSIVPLLYNGEWRAVVFPQTVSAGKTLVSITIDGRNYSLTKDEAMTYTSGKMHRFTITVNRNEASGQYEFVFSGEAITRWTDDSSLHEGIVRQYVVVEVNEAGTLKDVLTANGIDYLQVQNLKVVGNLNSDDRDLLSAMPRISNLNLQKVLMVDSIFHGFRESSVQHLVMPEKGIKSINGETLMGATSLKGSLVIPEGVEYIGWGFCFNAKSMTAVPQLPSTLKVCDGGFFQHVDKASGNFQLPDGIESWGGGLDGKVTGEMYLPASLKYFGSSPSQVTGTIHIPQGCEIDDGTFANSQCTAVVLPEGMTEIPGNCFRGSQLRGELVLPSTIQHINGGAFGGTKITKVIFPDALKLMDDDCIFDGCSRLTGTVELPKNVSRLPKRCFKDCSAITGLVFPEGTMVIGEMCFQGCSSIASIVCEGEEPPVVCENAFLGVPKDNFTVEVPKGCVDKYKNASGWSDFKRISEYSNFVCRPSQAQALNTMHSEELVLNADGDWTVASQPDWVTLSNTSGTGKTALTLTFQKLPQGNGNRTGDIVFRMQQGTETITTTCTVSQYDYTYEEDACLTLQTATKGNRKDISIVFVGEGYDGASIADETYLDLVKYQTECFFAIEPYRSMRDYFNVYVTFPLSQEKGVNTMYTYVNNRFGTLYGFSSLTLFSSCTSSELITESDEVMDYVVNHTPVTTDNLGRTLVILVPNTTDYEGHTEYFNGTLSICPPSAQSYPRDTRGVIQHEAGGHGFGKLGDELIIENKFAPISVKNEIEEKHERGWYANLATTGKLSSVPWAEFIFDTKYSDYVDVYEGGYGYTRHIYRPEANSCMNYGIPYYNTPSRRAIYRRILDYAEEGYTEEAFRAQDTFAWGPTEISTVQTRGMEAPQTGSVEGLTPYGSNHHEPVFIDFKKRGDEVRAIRKQLKEKLSNRK